MEAKPGACGDGAEADLGQAAATRAVHTTPRGRNDIRSSEYGPTLGRAELTHKVLRPMTKSSRHRGSAPAAVIGRTLGGPEVRAARSPTAAGLTLSAVRAFGGETHEAFVQACTLQRESLQYAEHRLAGLAGQLASVHELDAALRLKTQITECLADAADANVRIWADLVQQVRAGCGRFQAGPGSPSH